MFLTGDVDLNPEIMRKESGSMYLMTSELASLLRVVFLRLGHDVKVWIATDHPTRAYSDSGDWKEVADIKNLVNMTFAVYFECGCDIDASIRFLEKKDLMPPSEESVEYWSSKKR